MPIELLETVGISEPLSGLREADEISEVLDKEEEDEYDRCADGVEKWLNEPLNATLDGFSTDSRYDRWLGDSNDNGVIGGDVKRAVDEPVAYDEWTGNGYTHIPDIVRGRFAAK